MGVLNVSSVLGCPKCICIFSMRMIPREKKDHGPRIRNKRKVKTPMATSCMNKSPQRTCGYMTGLPSKTKDILHC